MDVQTKPEALVPLGVRRRIVRSRPVSRTLQPAPKSSDAHALDQNMGSAYDADKHRYHEFFNPGAMSRSGRREDIRTTPLFSLAVQHASIGAVSQDAVGTKASPTAQSTPVAGLLPQYGLLGFTIASTTPGINLHEPVLMNTDAPNSTFICGSQGAGKSYTASTILENLLITNGKTGKLKSPVAGLVFHYDANSAVSTAEAASLCSLGVKVRVLVAKSNYLELAAKYNKLKKRGNLTVEPLVLRSSDLSVERILKLMAFDEQDGSPPLYFEVIMRVLRDMSMAINFEGTVKQFDYRQFKARLANENLAPAQMIMLNMRLSILESFMELTPGRSNQGNSLLSLEPGTLTILDLSSAFMTASTSCALFDICLSIVQQKRHVGLAVVLDEAHKYMNKSSAAENFTNRLLTTIREQRHNGTRVIIATQEPTISESLLDLCSTSIIHRFSSPAWFASIEKHLAGASSRGGGAEGRQEMFNSITSLDTGESLVFSPASFLLMDDGGPAKLRSNVLKMRTRVRVSDDAGVSLLASDQASNPAAPSHDNHEGSDDEDDEDDEGAEAPWDDAYSEDDESASDA